MQTQHLPRHRQAGFSLVEIMVTIFIFGVVTAGLLVIFDNSSRLARSQTQLANIQQGQRVGHSEIVRYLRMAGVGGLPISSLQVDDDDRTNRTYGPGYFPEGFAISIYNNIEEGTTIRQVFDDSDTTVDDIVMPGSDVLVVRGIFTTPVYYFDPPITLSDSDLNADETELTALLQIPGVMRLTGQEDEDRLQDLDPMVEMLKAAYGRSDTDMKPEALLIRDVLNPNAYAVVGFDHDAGSLTAATDLDPEECNVTKPDGYTLRAECVEVPVALSTTSTGGDIGYVGLTNGTTLATGSGGVTLENAAGTEVAEVPTRIGSVGLLEEYRFFVRVEQVWDGLSNEQRIAPVLTRARYMPGSNVELERVDIADNVIDLQLAVGVETDSFGDLGYGTITDNGNGTDEVLFNSSADLNVGGSPPYVDPPTGTVPGGHLVWYNEDLEYHFIRINTIVQADRRSDRGYQSPLLTAIEDYNRGNYSLGDRGTFNDLDARRFRRRWLQTTVELRNLN